MSRLYNRQHWADRFKEWFCHWSRFLTSRLYNWQHWADRFKEWLGHWG